jgi:hypothetical protein
VFAAFPCSAVLKPLDSVQINIKIARKNPTGKSIRLHQRLFLFIPDPHPLVAIQMAWQRQESFAFFLATPLVICWLTVPVSMSSRQFAPAKRFFGKILFKKLQAVSPLATLQSVTPDVTLAKSSRV